MEVEANRWLRLPLRTKNKGRPRLHLFGQMGQKAVWASTVSGIRAGYLGIEYGVWILDRMSGTGHGVWRSGPVSQQAP